MRYLLFIGLFVIAPVMQAQTAQQPMIMPAAGDPGPSTWMFGQAYGNTTGAYNFGDLWYRAGQGLHFGIDLSMPCGTPLVAVANGTVQFVDDKGFGSMPHNIIIRHEAIGVTTLYGHLLQPPTVMPGQLVQQGEVIGLSGDPDETCYSRPHLHFEVRSLDYSRTLNPVDLIDANWHSLALIGPYGFPLFQHDLQNPRRWVTLSDQPDVYFWGGVLNRYTTTYPASSERRPAPSPIAARDAPQLPPTATFTSRQLTSDGCCALASWDAADPTRFYTVDGPAGGVASVFAWDALSPASGGTRLQPAPRPYSSPHGIYTLEPFINNTTKIKGPDFEVNVNTGGRVPTVNPANTALLWAIRANVTVPGQQRPATSIYLSQLNGESAREIFSAPGADARWLDNTRVLISIRDERRQTRLLTYDTHTNTQTDYGTWSELRGLSASPGGRYVSFYLAWQPNPADNGVYLMDTSAASEPSQMPWFGAWRWRDTDTLYYIPYQPGSSVHTLRLYDIGTGEDRALTDPSTTAFTVANGTWHISADGTRVLYQDARDSNLYVLEELAQ
jgi:hypothetical protein